MQTVMINSKRQGEMFELVKKLRYVPYPVLFNLSNKAKFKKDFKTLVSAGYLKTIKTDYKVWVMTFDAEEYFDERKYELFAWFYLKLIKSGGELLDDCKIKTSTGIIFVFEILPEINSVKLHGERRYLASLHDLQDFNKSFGQSWHKVNF